MQHKPKKSLGQNFLYDPNIKRKIIASCGLEGCDIVLEIGPGRGALTGPIAERVKRLYAVEIDPYLCEYLKESLKLMRNVKIIKADILKLDLGKYLGSSRASVKVIANIPYYITTPIIEALFKVRGRLGDVFLTVQKEFAHRIIASAGSKDYGAFSCFVQYYSRPSILFDIKKTCFYPAPKVDSSFLRLEIKKEQDIIAKNEESLFKIIRHAFGQRRKTLKSSLRGIICEKKLEEFFDKYSIDNRIRPEQLSLKEFAALSNI